VVSDMSRRVGVRGRQDIAGMIETHRREGNGPRMSVRDARRVGGAMTRMGDGRLGGVRASQRLTASLVSFSASEMAARCSSSSRRHCVA
jgi:hypothetical protein